MEYSKTAIRTSKVLARRNVKNVQRSVKRQLVPCSLSPRRPRVVGGNRAWGYVPVLRMRPLSHLRCHVRRRILLVRWAHRRTGWLARHSVGLSGLHDGLRMYEHGAVRVHGRHRRLHDGAHEWHTRRSALHTGILLRGVRVRTWVWVWVRVGLHPWRGHGGRVHGHGAGR